MGFSEFENMIKGLFEPDYPFDTSLIASWSSMQSLIIVSAIDEHYDVLLSHQELKSAKNIHELHNIITKKKS
jgi:acyl carrier protein